MDTMLMWIGVLVTLTNLTVEVLKPLTCGRLSTNVLALVTAECLTVLSGGAYCQMYRVPFHWYTGVALMLGGILVAYAAMFGFDKLRETLEGGDAHADGK